MSCSGLRPSGRWPCSQDAPALAVVLVVGTTWSEVSAADTKGLAWGVWLMIVLTGAVTTVLVAIAESARCAPTA